MQHLKKRLARGQRDAFVELYDSMGESLFRYIVSRTGNHDSAADVLQDVFVRLVRFHRQFKQVDNIQAYVFRTARNESIRWLEKNPPPIAVPEREDVKTPAGIEDEDWVQHTLNELDTVDREIVQLKTFSEMTFKEIGGLLEMPQATVATRYRRAIRRLALNLTRTETIATPQMEQPK